MSEQVICNSPIGKLLVATDGASITRLDFAGSEEKTSKNTSNPLLSAALAQLDEYFAGKRKHFDLPLKPKGTEFQQKVWAELLSIPYGETRTYKEVAEAVNCPKGYRAVGLANNRNPIAVIIPCHRVIGSGGSMVGYAGGTDKKQLLLRLERALPGSGQA